MSSVFVVEDRKERYRADSEMGAMNVNNVQEVKSPRGCRGPASVPSHEGKEI
jgi:hypothetical protein